jgi:hypothetical protein
MKPSEIRDELLSQHEGVRGHLDAAQRAATRWTRGEASWSHVRDELARLSDALRAHNLREERALRDLIRCVDACGPAREEMMDDEHVREHREIHDTLVRIGQAQEPGEGARELERFSNKLLAHMTWEEKAFLNETVLRDEDVAIDAQGG